jgi:subfamily B ATP-binding cassette protein MsbA
MPGRNCLRPDPSSGTLIWDHFIRQSLVVDSERTAVFRRKVHALFSDRYSSASLIYRVLASEGSRHWPSYALNFMLMGVAAACTAFSAYLVGHVFSATYIARNFHVIVGLAALTVLIFLIKGFASYAQAVLLAQIGNEIVARNQQQVITKVLRQSLGYFTNRPSAEIMTQITAGSSSVSAVLDLLICAVGRDSVSLIGLMTVMVIQDPLMSMCALVVMPAAFTTVRKLTRRLRLSFVDQMGGMAKMMEILQESLQGLRIVKAFGLEQEFDRRVERVAQSTRAAGNLMAQLSNRSGPLMETLGGIAIALVFLYGGYRVTVTNAAPGAFISFVTAFLLAYEPAKRLARLHIDLRIKLAGVRMYYELLDAPPTEPEDSHKPALQVNAGRLEFRRVQFGYRPERVALADMSFAAEPGRVTALVGMSGGGKSTTFNLILRLYEPDTGAILIDGQDISNCSRQSLRRQIAYVGQDVFLFGGSIRENIAYGNLSAGEEQIVGAAKAAHAHEFITLLPQGYDSYVGERGMQLSAGQRQRISIARALLKQAPIILLDEPTSALDSESEQLIQNALAELCVGRTTLVIAHRLHTIRDADHINVVEEGTVIESGRHRELLLRGGRYASFYRHMLNESISDERRIVSFRSRN